MHGAQESAELGARMGRRLTPAERRWSGAADALGVATAERRRGLEEIRNRRELGGREAARQQLLPVLHQRSPDLAGLLEVAVGDLDADLAAVDRIAHAAREPGSLEPVEDAGDRAGGEP